MFLTAIKTRVQSVSINTGMAMQDYSKRALMDFIETSIKKGWINVNTGGGVRTACRQILDQVADEEDVRGVDVPGAIARFANRNPGKLSGPSLGVYRSRVQGMLDSFVSFVSDPVAYRPAAKVAGARPKNGEAKASSVSSKKREIPTPVPAQPPAPSTHNTVVRAAATETSLTLPFNLRPDFLAQITVPRDLTKDEAKRLAAFIDALAI